MTHYIIIGAAATQEELKTAIHFLPNVEIVFCLMCRQNFYIDVTNFPIIDGKAISPNTEGKFIYLNHKDYNVLHHIINKHPSMLFCQKENLTRIQQDIGETEIFLQLSNKQIRKAKNAELQPLLR